MPVSRCSGDTGMMAGHRSEWPMGIREALHRQRTGAESGLDNFGARYMSAAQGRFTSPEPLLASGRAEDSRSWNRYGYARSNPLTYVDPTGLDLVSTGNANNPYSWVDKCASQFNAK
jgi:RHS repeat-associated protein